MKKFSSLLFIMLALGFTQCLEQTEKVVPYENTEEIQRKLKELRDIQREVEASKVSAANYEIDIVNKIEELNDLIAPGNVPITYSIGILSAAGSQNSVGISNATVSLDVRGERQIGTTSTDGQVVFENLRSGIVLVHISVAGYSDASFVADLRVEPDDDYNPGNSGNPYNVTSSIRLYPTTQANGAGIISGSLYYDPDRSDDILDNTDSRYGQIDYYNDSFFGSVYPYRPAEKIDLVDGEEVDRTKGTLDARIQSWEELDVPVTVFAFVKPNPADYSSVPAGTAGHIVMALYEELFVSAASTAAGTYSMVIPAGINSNDIRISLSLF
ncbi:MAG TPA: hypothetical protein VEB86_08435, partial [Chryseosolibacter sp.]|nr:hypothetical protein [Chryseosolibacter sp.]